MNCLKLILTLCIPFALVGCNVGESSDGGGGNRDNADPTGIPSGSTIFAQQAYLKANNAGEGDWFGRSVTLDNDTLAVGAHREAGDANSTEENPNDNAYRAGAVYVFTRNSGTWNQQAYLKASDAEVNDLFGGSVALNGDTLVVGASRKDNSGAVYVFTRSDGEWSQQALLKASNARSSDAFGSSVALDGDTLVVGAWGESGDANSTVDNPNRNASSAGAAYVFTRSNGVWSQQAYLKASNAGRYDYFGISVVIDNDTLVVGANREDGDATSTVANPNDNASDAGAIYVFTRSGGMWSQQAYLKASNAGESDGFGVSFALEDDMIVVGAPREAGDAHSTAEKPNDAAVGAGAAYVFTRDGGVWSQQAYLKASDAWLGHRFGISVALKGDILVVGARGRNGEAVSSGATYVFIRNGEAWNQQGYLTANNPGRTDWFGDKVAFDGNTLVVGARREAGDATSTVANPNDNAPQAGAVYVFR